MPDRKRVNEPIDDRGPLPRRDLHADESKERRAPSTDEETKQREAESERQPEEPHGKSGAV